MDWWFYIVGFWVLLLVLLIGKAHYKGIIEEKNNIIAENNKLIENLKDAEFVRKEKQIMEKQLQALNNIMSYSSIKITRIPLGNLVRAFKSPYIWLQLKDMTTLEITDGYSIVTLKCMPERIKELL